MDNARIDDVLKKIERTRQARRHKFYLRDEKISLSHGSGGKATHNLIEGVFAPAFSNPLLDAMDAAATFGIHGTGQRLAFTTDTYVVSPLFFPGGDIGKLAVHGTVNDLAVSGAEPLYLSLGLIVEEGLPLETLRRVILSRRDAARASRVSIVTGDTKVVARGAADGLFLNTAGIGRVRPGVDLGAHRIRPGDRVLVSGTVGDHGITILSAREGLGLESSLQSDSAPISELVARLLDGGLDVRFLRDPTRGGVSAVLHEIVEAAGVAGVGGEAGVPG